MRDVPAPTRRPTGPKGDKGAAGRDAKVTCKSSGKTKVRCTVKYANRKAKLTRNGRVYARGTASALAATRTLHAAGRLAVVPGPDLTHLCGAQLEFSLGLQEEAGCEAVVR
jgi:hypothetical protein